MFTSASVGHRYMPEKDNKSYKLMSMYAEIYKVSVFIHIAPNVRYV